MSFSDGRNETKLKKFSKRQTKILKGIAIGMLLIHHGLDPISREGMGIWRGMIENSISLSKLCVAVFAVLSGYGMYLSFQGKKEENTGKYPWRFVGCHMFKLYSVFWLTALLAIGITALVKGNFADIYRNHPVYYLFLDVMGLSYLTKSPKFVNSWWYVTATLIYYGIFPLLFWLTGKLKKWNGVLLAGLAIVMLGFAGLNSIVVYGCFFLFGMIFAERDVLNRILNCMEESRLRRVLKTGGLFLLLVILGIFRQGFLKGTGTDYYLDWLLALILILFVGELTGGWKWERPGLLELTGAYSFEIYLIHGMFLKYFGRFVYSSSHCWAVLLRLFAASFVAAAVIRRLEKRLRPASLFRSKQAAWILIGTWILLLLPVAVGNLGIGKLVPLEENITMENGTWHVPLYAETPLFWDFAMKKYSSDQWDMVSFVDGVLYSHDTGNTTVTVSLPFGKSVSCQVTVKESVSQGGQLLTELSGFIQWKGVIPCERNMGATCLLKHIQKKICSQNMGKPMFCGRIRQRLRSTLR